MRRERREEYAPTDTERRLDTGRIDEHKYLGMERPVYYLGHDPSLKKPMLRLMVAGSVVGIPSAIRLLGEVALPWFLGLTFAFVPIVTLFLSRRQTGNRVRYLETNGYAAAGQRYQTGAKRLYVAQGLMGVIWIFWLVSSLIPSAVMIGACCVVWVAAQIMRYRLNQSVDLQKVARTEIQKERSRESDEAVAFRSYSIEDD